MDQIWIPHELPLEQTKERAKRFFPSTETRERLKKLYNIDYEPEGVMLAQVERSFKDLIWDDAVKIGTRLVLDDCVAYTPSNWDPTRYDEEAFTRWEIEKYHSGKRVDGQTEESKWILQPGDPCFMRAGCLWVKRDDEDDAPHRRANNFAVFIEDVRALPEPDAVQGARFCDGRRCCMVDLEIPFHGQTRYMVHASNIRYRR